MNPNRGQRTKQARSGSAVGSPVSFVTFVSFCKNAFAFDAENRFNTERSQRRLIFYASR